jgi:small subunit ribosomal protein S16
MSVRIRLTAAGRKNEKYWRIAVFDSRTRRDGAYLENLGTYNPREAKPEAKVKIDLDRYKAWLSKGALPTDSVGRLLKHVGAVPKK